MRDAGASPRLAAWASDAAVVLCVSVLAALFVWSGEVAPHKWANHDVANALYIGGRLLEGERLYVDWLYFVMPSAMFLYTAGCGVGRLLGLSPPTAAHGMVLALALLGAWVIRRALPPATPRLLVTLAYLALLAQAGLFPVDFAQREHLFALLLVPYAVWRLSGSATSAPVLALAVALGCAATIKPHLLAALLVLEIFFLGERGRRLGPWLALGAGAALPWLWLVLQSPDSLSGFFDQLVSFYSAGSYDPFSRPAARFLRAQRQPLLIGLGLLLLGGAAWARVRGAATTRACAAAGVTAALLYASVLQQAKFFTYHEIAYAGVAWVLGVYFTALAADSLPRRAWRGGVAGVLALLALVGVGRGTLGLARLLRAGPTRHAQPVLPLLEGQQRIAIMSTSVEGDIFAYAFSHDLEIMGPWTSNYTVPALLGIRDPEERRRAFEAYFEPIARKLRSERPGLVLFSPFHQALPGRMTIHDLFVHEYHLFPTPGYRLWRETRGGWIVYRRVPEAG